MPRARFDDRRVRGLAGHDRRGRMALIGLSLAFACATSKGAPIQSGPAPENPERAASTLANQESVELVDPEPAAIEPMLVGDPAPWLEDADLRERILAVQPIVEAAAAARELDPALINGVIYVESKFDPKAKGGDAQGLMQLMPKTAASLAKDLDRKRNSYDPDFNIHAGALLIRRLLDRFDGDVELALAAYNRGTGVVAGWVREGEPIPARTQGFVDRVLRARAWFLTSPPA